MASPDCALSNLLEVFRTGESIDSVRECAWISMQALMDVGAIGAGRREPTESRETKRNGSRPRLLTTHAGDIRLSVPKPRVGSFHPSAPSPQRRIHHPLYTAAIEAYVHGVSTRSVDESRNSQDLWMGVSRDLLIGS